MSVFYGSPIKSIRTGKQSKSQPNQQGPVLPEPLWTGPQGQDAHTSCARLYQPLAFLRTHLQCKLREIIPPASPSLERQAEFSSRYWEFLAWEWDPFTLTYPPPGLQNKFH